MRILVVDDAKKHRESALEQFGDEHLMSAAIDWIAAGYWNSEGNHIFRINQSRVLIAHAPMLEDGRKDWQAAFRILQECHIQP